ncbi:hypothetical protein AC249_AIPGENE12719, partial [Exaiptasia diaphana]
MKRALESYGGLKGCRAAVVEIDASKHLHEANKIPEISLLYNFQYEMEGIRVWKAFNVGKGKHLNSKDLIVHQESIACLKVTEAFGPRQKERGAIRRTPSSSAEIFSCLNSSCVLTFKTQQEVEAHMDAGKHVEELESVSLYDSIRIKWAERVTGISNVPSQYGSEVGEDQGVPHKTSESRSMGWALKKTKKRPRIGDKVKAYLIEKFQAGEISGTKADPLSVSREMKSKKDEKGELVFQPDEWKTAQTIKSFFSRYRAKLRQQQIGSQSEEEDEIAEEDMEALEAETDLQDLRSEVYSDLRKPEHPIEVDGINVCHLVQKKKLMSLKVRELTAICETIGIPIEGPKGKK